MGKTRGLLTVVRSQLPVGCLPNCAPWRLSVRRPRSYYRCAPNRNRSVYYELTSNLIAQRPVSTRDSAKQLDLFEEVTHSPYQPGGKRRRELSADQIPAETSLVVRHWTFVIRHVALLHSVLLTIQIFASCANYSGGRRIPNGQAERKSFTLRRRGR